MILKLIKLAFVATMVTLGVAGASSAQILTIDDERVEREALAYKDFNLQTAELRQNILQLRQYTTRGGTAEAQLAALEEQKAVIGEAKYAEERGKLETQYVNAQQALNQLEYHFDTLRNEATEQVNSAQRVAVDKLLADRKADIVMLKRIALGVAPGFDITTEYIELLDAALPVVTLTMPKAAAAQ